MTPAARNLFESGTERYFDANVTFLGVMLSTSEVLVKYKLFDYFESWYNNSTFPCYQNWKKIVRCKILAFESETWSQFCEAHPDIRVTQASFENMPPHHFWSSTDKYSDLVTRMHTQVRLMSNFGLNGSVPWLKDTKGALRFICKQDIENLNHFLLDCPQNFGSIWRNLELKIIRSNLTDGIQIANFIKKLDRQHTVMLLVGGLSLPFDNETVTLIKKFISSAVGKIYKVRIEKLRELEAQYSFFTYYCKILLFCILIILIDAFFVN